MCSGKNIDGEEEIMDVIKRIKTGIIGLDEVTEGGFEENSQNMVAGGEGTYKSTFALQFAIQGIRDGETATYVSLEEPKESFQRIAERAGWQKEFSKIDFKSIDVNDILYKQVDHWDVDYPVKGAELIAHAILGSIDNPNRLVFDTATTLALYASRTGVKELPGNHWSFVKPSPGDIRVMLYYLVNTCRAKKNTTTLFLAESGEGDLYVPEHVLKYICDTKIEVKKSGLGTGAPRTLQIHKMRHTIHPLDEMALDFTEQGLAITPTKYILEKHA